LIITQRDSSLLRTKPLPELLAACGFVWGLSFFNPIGIQRSGRGDQFLCFIQPDMGNYPIPPILAQVIASKLWHLLFDDISASHLDRERAVQSLVNGQCLAKKLLRLNQFILSV